MKYVTGKADGMRSVVIFPGQLEHNKAARVFDEVLGAGTVEILSLGSETENPVVKCSGNSHSLKIQSRGEIDEEIIQISLGM